MEPSFWMFILVGFVAQLIDGSLGMAYGVSSTTVLLSIGITPALASASVHMAEIVTTAISGLSHLKFGNVDKTLVWPLLLPGVVGSMLGAYILVNMPVDVIKPLVAIYLLIMGLVILVKALRRAPPSDTTRGLMPLGFIGGFFDAIGGGGWGPIVTTTLVARGGEPRRTIGSVNLAEFFVTLAQSVVFILTLGLVHWNIILGLLIGGAIAAPLAAYVCKIIPSRALMLLVAALIMLLSIRTIYLALV